ncbi:MAG: hypothetical protein ACR2QM_07790 [Longimicrobiales bacterium]
MAKTLLNGVNEVLKRVGLIQGDSGLLTTLSDSPRQTYIDLAVQVWNESVEQLYTTSGVSLPLEMAESSITLVTNDRDYALQTDLVALKWPLQNRDKGEYIHEWKKGYHDLIVSQPQPDQWEGLATFAAIRPSDGELFLERIPIAEQNGRVFTYNYDKDISLSVAADTFPFDDAVFRAMVPVVAELWALRKNRSGEGGVIKLNYGRASRLLTRQPMRSSWLPR